MPPMKAKSGLRVWGSRGRSVCCGIPLTSEEDSTFGGRVKRAQASPMEVAGKPTPVATVLCPAGEGGAGTYAEARRSPTPPAVPAEPDQLDCGADICPQAVKLDVLASDSVTGTEFEGMEGATESTGVTSTQLTTTTLTLTDASMLSHGSSVEADYASPQPSGRKHHEDSDGVAATALAPITPEAALPRRTPADTPDSASTSAPSSSKTSPTRAPSVVSDECPTQASPSGPHPPPGSDVDGSWAGPSTRASHREYTWVSGSSVRDSIVQDRVRPASPDDGLMPPSCFGGVSVRSLTCVRCGSPTRGPPTPLAEALRNVRPGLGGLERGTSAISGFLQGTFGYPYTPSGSLVGSPMGPVPLQSPMGAERGWVSASPAPSTPASVRPSADDDEEDDSAGVSECEVDPDAGVASDWVHASFQAAVFTAVRNQLEVESEKELMRKLAEATGAMPQGGHAGGGALPEEAAWARGAGRPMEASTRKLAACFERAIHDAMEARPPATRPTPPAGAGPGGDGGVDSTCRRLARYFDQVVHEAMDGASTSSGAPKQEAGSSDTPPVDPAGDPGDRIATARQRLAKSFELALQQAGVDPAQLRGTEQRPASPGASSTPDATPPHPDTSAGSQPVALSTAPPPPTGHAGATAVTTAVTPTPQGTPEGARRRPPSLDVTTPRAMSSVRIAASALEAGGVPAFIPSPSGPRTVEKVVTSKPASRLVSGPKAPPPRGLAFVPPRPPGPDDAVHPVDAAQPLKSAGSDAASASEEGSMDPQDDVSSSRSDEAGPTPTPALGGNSAAHPPPLSPIATDLTESGTPDFHSPTLSGEGERGELLPPAASPPQAREAFDDLLGSLASITSGFDELIETLPMTDEMRESYGNLSVLFASRRSIDSPVGPDPFGPFARRSVEVRMSKLGHWDGGSPASQGKGDARSPRLALRERVPSSTEEAIAEAATLMVDRTHDSVDDILELMLAVDTQDLWDLLSPDATIMDLPRDEELPDFIVSPPPIFPGETPLASAYATLAGAGLPPIRVGRQRSPDRGTSSSVSTRVLPPPILRRPRARPATRGLAVRAAARRSTTFGADPAGPVRRQGLTPGVISFAPRPAGPTPPPALEIPPADVTSSPRGFGHLPIAGLPIAKPRSPGATPDKARSPLSRRSPLAPRAVLRLPRGDRALALTEAELAAMPGAVSPRASSSRGSSSDGTPLTSPQSTPERSPYSKETARQYAPVFSTEELSHPSSPGCTAMGSVARGPPGQSTAGLDVGELPPLQESSSPRVGSTTGSPTKRIGQVVASIQEELLARASMDSIRSTPTRAAVVPLTKSTEVKDIISMFQAAAATAMGGADRPKTLRCSSEGIPPLAPRHMAPRASADNFLLHKWRTAEEAEARRGSKLSGNPKTTSRNLSAVFNADTCPTPAPTPPEIWPPEKPQRGNRAVTHVYACDASMAGYPYGVGPVPRYGGGPPAPLHVTTTGASATASWDNGAWPPEAGSAGAQRAGTWSAEDVFEIAELEQCVEETLEHAVSFDALVGW